jgi:glycosyltransferase involved in cell wall biosynthesis
MKITFLLPSRATKPQGGFKVVYEYANGLTRRGHKVSIVHPANIINSNSLVTNFRKSMGYILRKIDGSYKPNSWFDIEENVEMLFVPNMDEKYIPNSDVIVATAWNTALNVMKYGESKGKKFYLIQSLETWWGSEKDVLKTWKSNLKKIVISKWLAQYAREIGVNVTYIPNGLDFEKFGMDILPENRNPNSILMMVDNLPVKGSKYGIEAIKVLRIRHKGLKVYAFGKDYFEEELPKFFKFYHEPAQNKLRELYNQAAIFLSPSIVEGFPLPPAEAMMCGAALIASNIGGHKEYAFDGSNALLFQPRDVNDMVENVEKLLTDVNLRIRLAYEGNKYVQRFQWDNSIEAFEKVLLDNQ